MFILKQPHLASGYCIGQHSFRYFLNVSGYRLIRGKPNQENTLRECAVLSPFLELPWIPHFKKMLFLEGKKEGRKEGRKEGKKRGRKGCFKSIAV